MGSGFDDGMTRREAANRLGITLRCITNYVNRGYIRKGLRDGEVALSREDIEQMAIDLGTDAPALNRKNFIALSREFEVMKRDMELLKRSWQVNNQPALRPNPDTCKQLQLMATTLLSADKIDLAMTKKWAALISSMDEETFNLLGRALALDRPWQVFFQLVMKMLVETESLPGFRRDLELQKLYEQLDQTRIRMRSIILVWIETGQGSIGDQVLKVLETRKEGLVRRLSKSR